MLLASKSEILAVDLTTLDTKVTVDGKRDIQALAIDARSKKMYFAKHGKEIRRVNYDGTYEESVLKNAETTSLTIDWMGRRVFWTEYLMIPINVATLKGKDSRTINTATQPDNIAIDPIEG